MNEIQSTPLPETLAGVQQMEINFGPQHPSTHGVLRVLVELDGEKILKAKPIIGYLHRGTEKLFETQTYPMVIPHTDRLDYVAAATNNHAYVGAVEKLMGLVVPERAQYIRVILDEMQRIASHEVWLGTHALDIGAVTPFWYTFREREVILDLFEDYCGARLTLNCMRIGGLPVDLPAGWLDKLEAFVDDFPSKVDDYENLLTENRIWKKRTVGVGILTPEDAIAWGVTGPPLRGSGIQWDVRRAKPYEVYDKLDFVIPVGKNCDTYDRYLVRMVEMRQSGRIIKQAIGWLRAHPEGEIRAKVPRVVKPPVGEVYFSVEAPKGELGFSLVSNGGNKPYRLKVRPPCFINLQAMPLMVEGGLVADMVAVIGTLDIVLGEIDR
jgi:NADH-quinone oxidoreductase subunit D